MSKVPTFYRPVSRSAIEKVLGDQIILDYHSSTLVVKWEVTCICSDLFTVML
jgi:hypothetical protein